MRIRIFRDAEALAVAAADEIAGWLRFDPRPTIGLAGGSTPIPVYEALRDEDVPGSSVVAWMTDERHVPHDHEDSNLRSAREALFDHVGGEVLPVPWLPEDPVEAARQYDETLRRRLPIGAGGVTPGLVLLGVGDDGHTASLFPGSDELSDDRRAFVATWVEDKEAWRHTATLPLLAAARRTMFIVSGSAKAEIVHEVLDVEADHPATRVSKAARDAVWLLDREAAAGLERDT